MKPVNEWVLVEATNEPITFEQSCEILAEMEISGELTGSVYNNLNNEEKVYVDKIRYEHSNI